MRNVAGSSNHLIRLEKEEWGNRKSERLSGLQVDHQLELCGLFHREVGRLGALQNAIDVRGRPTEHRLIVRPAVSADLLYGFGHVNL